MENNLILTKQEKKEYIKRMLANGDRRSYNEIQADLELYLWTAKHKGIAEADRLSLKVKPISND